VAKSAQAFRSISEAADELGVAQHVLRFWETKFTFIKPMKRAGGRRFYRPADIAVLATVRRLLHDEGYSIKDVQALHRERALKPLVLVDETSATAEPVSRPKPSLASFNGLREALAALEAAKGRLDRLLV
jgi:DNA-binding transcriptional MerR regulator